MSDLTPRATCIYKFGNFAIYYIWNIQASIFENSKRLNYTNIRRNFSRKNGFFTPWLVHLHKKKGLWLYFSQLF